MNRGVLSLASYRYMNLGMRLYLHPCFPLADSGGSSETADCTAASKHWRLVDNTISIQKLISWPIF